MHTVHSPGTDLLSRFRTGRHVLAVSARWLCLIGRSRGRADGFNAAWGAILKGRVSLLGLCGLPVRGVQCDHRSALAEDRRVGGGILAIGS